jgi:putative protease
VKILAPADRLAEVRPLIDAGADELYGGFVPPEWDEAYAAVGSINKRTFAGAQFATFGELTEAVATARGMGVRFFLTLNNDFYSTKQMPAVINLAEEAAANGIAGLLVSDLGLILEVERLGLPLELHLSILSAVLNTQAALFYKDLSISRVVLDRTLTAQETAKIIGGVPGLEFEAFVMYGKCPNIEGLCSFFHHDDPDHVWPCGRECGFRTVPAESPEADAAVVAQAGWAKAVRGNACGLCGVYDLMKAGLTAAKIAGRGRKTEHKLAAVTALKSVRDLTAMGVSRVDVIKTARASHERLFSVPCSPYECYFPAEG